MVTNQKNKEIKKIFIKKENIGKLMKRGQITLFIIIGIVILLVISMVFYLRGRAPEAELEVKFEEEAEISLAAQPVDAFVQNCLKEVTEDAIDVIARQGGYFELPEISTADMVTNTAYYFYLGSGLVPSEDVIKAELKKYVDSQFEFCLRNLVDFEGYEFELGEPETSINFDEDIVIANIDFPLTIITDGARIPLNKFRAAVPSRLWVLYDTARQLTNIQVENPDQICLSCIAELAEENEINISVVEYENDTLLFVLMDEKVLLNDKPLRYRYTNKYSPVIEEAEEEEIVSIEPIPDQNATVGQRFVYYVNASGENLVFSDATELFDINTEEGLIDFVPAQEHVGSHVIWISVESQIPELEEATSTTSFVLNVLNTTG
jgi:hypothetical protein